MTIKCEICGNEFEYISKRGKPPKYCSVECKIAAAKKRQKAYIASVKDKKRAKSLLRKQEAEKTKAILNHDTPTIVSEPNHFVRQNLEPQLDKFKMKLIDIATKLDGCSLELHDFLNELSVEQSKRDKEDSIFLHNIETLREFDSNQSFVWLVQEVANRVGRREGKDLFSLAQQLKDSMPKNSLKLVKESIEKNRKTAEKLGSEIQITDNRVVIKRC